MTAQIQTISKDELQELISKKITPNLSASSSVNFRRAMLATTIVWGGKVDGEFKCLWGLIPPTLLSNEAYLWLHIIEPVGEYQFVFVRYSQMAVEEALRSFPVIRGHCAVGADRSIRWIKWLGGTFGEPDGMLIPFVIRSKNG